MSPGDILPPLLFVLLMSGLYWGLTAISVRSVLLNGLLAIVAAVGGVALWRSGSHDWGVDPLVILAAFLCLSVAVVATVAALVALGRRGPGAGRLRMLGLVVLILVYVGLGVALSVIGR